MLEKTASRTSYRGGEGQSVFPVPFPFFENSHIAAAIRRDDGVARILSPGVDFIVNRMSDSDGELILLGDSLPGDCVLHISRRVPMTQDILFHNQGPNSPQAVEEAVDKLTMIAQQIQDDVETRLPVPPEADAQEMAALLMETARFRETVAASLSGVEAALAEKAPSGHSHAVGEVRGMNALLAGKADADAVASALAAKAGKTDLLAKADAGHGHVMAEVNGLVETLAGKVDADDPRLDGVSVDHAASHAVGGSDPLRPEDIGCLSPPPDDGNPYLAAAGGWIRYYEPADPGGVTADHAQLLNRDAADQHPQEAVRGLTGALDAIRASVAGVAGKAQGLAESLAAKADKTELPALATGERNGLMSAADKTRLDILLDTGSLPEGGGSGSLLARDGQGNAVWKTPAQTAESLPRCSTDAAGVVRLSAAGGLAVDGDGCLGLARGFMQTLGFTTDGTSIGYALDHDLETRDILVQTYDDSGGQVHFGLTAVSESRIVLTADPPRPAGENYRVVVAGWRFAAARAAGTTAPPLESAASLFTISSPTADAPAEDVGATPAAELRRIAYAAEADTFLRQAQYYRAEAEGHRLAARLVRAEAAEDKARGYLRAYVAKKEEIRARHPDPA